MNAMENTRPLILLRPDEAARRLGCSKGTLYRLLAAGKLGYVRIGADRRIPEDAIEDYVRANTVAAIGAKQLSGPPTPTPRRTPRVRRVRNSG